MPNASKPAPIKKNHIVIDARLYGPRHTGLGRYTKNLLVALKDLTDFDKYKFTLLVYPELLDECRSDLGDSYNYVATKIRHYTFAEQLLLPFVIFSLQPDLVHFTQLDKPILYLGRSVVTVHDLIRHFSKGRETTTKTPALYWAKYFGYRLMSWFVLNFNYLIVPSNFWRNYLTRDLMIIPRKVITTYEAVDPAFLQNQSVPETKPQSFILYTGNLYPHKNIRVVLEALKSLPDISLKIICARDVFAQKIEKLVEDLKIASQVEFLGYVPDVEFKKFYKNALALVHPALLEGFSLTGLEAMALNCPVISSNASCLPEIYGKSVLYFDPYSPSQLVKQVKNLQNNSALRTKLLKLGSRQVKKYSWSKTALQTLNFYNEIIRQS